MKRPAIDKLRASFSSQYSVNAASGCWEWTAATQQQGYGYMGTFGLAGNSKPAHLISVFLHKDSSINLREPPTIHHKCFNVRCVNPDHLVVMTSYEQILHQQSTVLGVLDRIEVEYPQAGGEVEALRQRIRRIMGL